MDEQILMNMNARSAGVQQVRTRSCRGRAEGETQQAAAEEAGVQAADGGSQTTLEVSFEK